VLFRLGAFNTAGEGEYRHSNTFVTEKTSGPDRLVIGAADPLLLLSELTSLLSPTFFVLYILHTSRCSLSLARYQSPPLERDELECFIREFRDFLAEDGRHDLWIHSPASKSTLVWDRHNVIHAYGPLERFRSALVNLRFDEGEVVVPDPHVHYYHAQHDENEFKILSHFEWRSSPLRPEDLQ
jgi:hypothetical protein